MSAISDASVRPITHVMAVSGQAAFSVRSTGRVWQVSPIADRRTAQSEPGGALLSMGFANTSEPTSVEERILPTADGAILYDPRIFNHFEPDWLEPDAWHARHDVPDAPGRGAVRFVTGEAGDFALRHYRRGRPARAGAGGRGLSTQRRDLPGRHPDSPSARRPFAGRRARRTRSRGRRVAAHRCHHPALHDAGVCHADLNAHNIQLGGQGAVWLLDFDRGRLRRPGAWQRRNLARLLRSLEKLRANVPGFRYGAGDWRELVAGYRVGRSTDRAGQSPG